MPDPGWHDEADRLLAHRGPDGRGHYQDDRCELVHRRLALLDLSETGHQPLSNEDGTVFIIFNGEIYNHAELRKELVHRHVFRGTSDTEVMVHLYEDYGADMISRLRGMFAFAIYDSRRKELHLGRDRFGIKPLYFTFIGDELVFASEMKAILALRAFQPELDRQACYDFLGLSYVPETATGYSNIQILPKGHRLSFSPGVSSVPRRYWWPDIQPNPEMELSETVEHVDEALNNAMRQYIVADVPVAALLSGGIDSSLVVSAYREHLGERLRTFNVRFPDNDYDETPLALAVAKQCGTEHTTIDLEPGSVTGDLVMRLFTHFDQPFADTSLIPMYLVSKAINTHGIICTLSGDGGDEVFGGYDSFPRANKLASLARLPMLLQDSMAEIGRWSEVLTRDLGRQIRKAVELAQAGKMDISIMLSGLANYLSEAQKEQLLDAEARAGLASAQRLFANGRPHSATDLEELSRRLTQSLFDVGLPSDMLRKVDMMSMLAGLEVRVPLLDEAIVDLGLRLPHRLKTDGRRGKLVLRALASRRLSADIVNHPKHGFMIPLDILLDESCYEMLHDLLLSANSCTRALLNMEVLRQWLEMFRRARKGEREGSMSREGLYQRIFMILAIELCMRGRRLSW